MGNSQSHILRVELQMKEGELEDPKSKSTGHEVGHLDPSERKHKASSHHEEWLGWQKTQLSEGEGSHVEWDGGQ